MCTDTHTWMHVCAYIKIYKQRHFVASAFTSTHTHTHFLYRRHMFVQPQARGQRLPDPSHFPAHVAGAVYVCAICVCMRCSCMYWKRTRMEGSQLWHNVGKWIVRAKKCEDSECVSRWISISSFYTMHGYTTHMHHPLFSLAVYYTHTHGLRYSCLN